MLLSPEWCYSSTGSKDHFYEKVCDAVVHPTLPTPFKGEGEQRQGQRQLQKYTGDGSAGLQSGLGLQQQRRQANRLHPPRQLALLHSLAFRGGGGEEGNCRPIILSGYVNRVGGKQQRHLVTEAVITVGG